MPNDKNRPKGRGARQGRWPAALVKPIHNRPDTLAKRMTWMGSLGPSNIAPHPINRLSPKPSAGESGFLRKNQSRPAKNAAYPTAAAQCNQSGRPCQKAIAAHRPARITTDAIGKDNLATSSTLIQINVAAKESIAQRGARTIDPSNATYAPA